MRTGRVAPTFCSVLLTSSNFTAEYSRGKVLLANGDYKTIPVKLSFWMLRGGLYFLPKLKHINWFDFQHTASKVLNDSPTGPMDYTFPGASSFWFWFWFEWCKGPALVHNQPALANVRVLSCIRRYHVHDVQYQLSQFQPQS